MPIANDASALEPEPRSKGHRRPFDLRETSLQTAEQLAAERIPGRLDLDPHRAAAHEPRVPGERLGDIVGTQRRPAFFQQMPSLGDRVAFDAPTTQRAAQPALIVD